MKRRRRKQTHVLWITGIGAWSFHGGFLLIFYCLLSEGKACCVHDLNSHHSSCFSISRAEISDGEKRRGKQGGEDLVFTNVLFPIFDRGFILELAPLSINFLSINSLMLHMEYFSGSEWEELFRWATFIIILQKRLQLFPITSRSAKYLIHLSFLTMPAIRQCHDHCHNSLIEIRRKYKVSCTKISSHLRQH